MLKLQNNISGLLGMFALLPDPSPFIFTIWLRSAFVHTISLKKGFQWLLVCFCSYHITKVGLKCGVYTTWRQFQSQGPITPAELEQKTWNIFFPHSRTTVIVQSKCHFFYLTLTVYSNCHFFYITLTVYLKCLFFYLQCYGSSYLQGSACRHKAKQETEQSSSPMIPRHPLQIFSSVSTAFQSLKKINPTCPTQSAYHNTCNKGSSHH